MRRQVAAQRLDRPLGMPLLGEREHRVEDDHGDDRDAERQRPGDDREAGRRPEEQGERVRELLAELGRPGRAAPALQLVAAVDGEAALDLALRQAARAGAQVAVEKLERSARSGLERVPPVCSGETAIGSVIVPGGPLDRIGAATEVPRGFPTAPVSTGIASGRDPGRFARRHPPRRSDPPAASAAQPARRTRCRRCSQRLSPRARSRRFHGRAGADSLARAGGARPGLARARLARRHVLDGRRRADRGARDLRAAAGSRCGRGRVRRRGRVPGPGSRNAAARAARRRCAAEAGIERFVADVLAGEHADAAGVRRRRIPGDPAPRRRRDQGRAAPGADAGLHRAP